MASDPDIAATGPYWQGLNTYANSPSAISINSNTSSSASSVFSVDAQSVQSSASSVSAHWTHSSWNQENVSASCCQSQRDGQNIASQQNLPLRPLQQTCANAVAPEARQHPRRTQRLYSQESQNGQNVAPCLKAPPSLVRQSERKLNFVDSLVDTTTQMVETIWPLAAHIQSRPSVTCARQPSKMELRYFIQEVLRRSKTSYSTLQVALYYLVLIQPHVPKLDFTKEQPEDSPSSFSLQCGRRMFIAALILASKYLQDRNFSANAWSKISGLSTWDLNINELAFVSAINWKLHIPEHVFNKWTDIVLKYSPSSSSNGAPRSFPEPKLSWTDVVVRLTPDLDSVDFGNAELSDDSGYDSPSSPESVMSPPPIPSREDLRSRSNEPTPTPSASVPQWLEQTPSVKTTVDARMQRPSLPPMQPHPPLLPTPQLTPQTGPFCTPAASASGTFSRRSSMCQAMAQIQDASMARCTLDCTSDWKPRVPEGFPTLARRTSLATSASSVSSPDTQISDFSTQYSDGSARPSRSSSISSVASSNCAPAPPTRLAVQATRRCANMQLNGLKEQTQMCRSPSEMVYGALRSSKCSNENTPPSTVSPNRKLPTPPSSGDDMPFPLNPRPLKRSTTHQPSATAATFPAASDTRDAATALQSLGIDRTFIQQHCNYAPSNRSQLPYPLPRTNSSEARKRARPNSMDLSVEDAVRQMIAPRCMADITNTHPDEGAVVEDDRVADSWLLRKENRHAVREANKKPTKAVKALGENAGNMAALKENLPRKRTCAGRAGSDRGGSDEVRRVVAGLR